MEEAIAGEVIGVGGAAFPWGEFGLAGVVIASLLFVIIKGGNKWFDSAQKREDRDAESRKEMYKKFDNLADAIRENTKVMEHHTQAIVNMTASVGRLPCTQRDPELRTRAGDRRVV